MPTIQTEAEGLRVLAELLSAVPADLPCWVQVLGSRQATVHIDTWGLADDDALDAFNRAGEALEDRYGAVRAATLEPERAEQYLATDVAERVEGWRLSVWMLKPANLRAGAAA